MWQTVRPTLTAEWLCTRCGATNRKLLPETVDAADDRCMTCRAVHRITRGETPVRWTATAG